LIPAFSTSIRFINAQRSQFSSFLTTALNWMTFWLAQPMSVYIGPLPTIGFLNVIILSFQITNVLLVMAVRFSVLLGQFFAFVSFDDANPNAAVLYILEQIVIISHHFYRLYRHAEERLCPSRKSRSSNDFILHFCRVGGLIRRRPTIHF
jgi:hypothetical protein